MCLTQESQRFAVCEGDMAELPLNSGSRSSLEQSNEECGIYHVQVWLSLKKNDNEDSPPLLIVGIGVLSFYRELHIINLEEN